MNGAKKKKRDIRRATIKTVVVFKKKNSDSCRHRCQVYLCWNLGVNLQYYIDFSFGG